MQTQSLAGSSKAQMKIQQMIFMLVAVTIFFGMIALIYFSISTSNLRSAAIELQGEEARAIVRKLSGSPELAFTSSSGCSSCIDLDKALQLKDIENYEKLWNLNYLFIEIISPSHTEVECTTDIFPNCNRITIIPEPSTYATKTAFVTLVRWDGNKYKYEFGRIHASPKEIN